VGAVLSGGVVVIGMSFSCGYAGKGRDKGKHTQLLK